MFIENISKKAVMDGHHYDAGVNSMLIQISDPACEAPTPKHQFKEIHQFEFLDLEENDECIEPGFKISDEQAKEIARLLQHALDNSMNVVVHCHAGVCRSGAVAEVGIMMGFDDTEAFRTPNLMVKHKIMQQLGMCYNPEETPTQNGRPIRYTEYGFDYLDEIDNDKQD